MWITRRAISNRPQYEDSECGVKMVRFEDKNPRVYKTVSIRLPTTWQGS
jgi:hypothetical protein